MNKKILLVEDNADISYALQIMLRYSGYEVEAITDGDETFDKVRDFKPDLILLDALLSGNDGQTIAKQLKGDDATKKICIVMMSAHPNGEKMANECGADDFIAKPFDVDELLKNIKKNIDASSAAIN